MLNQYSTVYIYFFLATGSSRTLLATARPLVRNARPTTATDTRTTTREGRGTGRDGRAGKRGGRGAAHRPHAGLQGPAPGTPKNRANAHANAGNNGPSMEWNGHGTCGAGRARHVKHTPLQKVYRRRGTAEHQRRFLARTGGRHIATHLESHCSDAHQCSSRIAQPSSGPRSSASRLPFSTVTSHL